MPEAIVLRIEKEHVFLHENQGHIQTHSYDPRFLTRVADGPELVESIRENVFTMPIRRHAFMQSRTNRIDTLFAVSPEIERILNIEINEMNRLRKHAEDMQHASVIDKQQMKVYKREFYAVLEASWFRRLIWAFTGDIN